ncbi:hypothetical protein ANO11243_003540 [Dothideomycetidae sp. 11243]|nr:hypothetical protein ANO11243_003540 [fungal sp. No.11243]
MAKRHVVFDVVGTCVSFDAFFDSVEATLGQRLLSHNITATHFGFTWMNAAVTEFMFLSISEHYTPYKNVLRALFYRTLYMSGVQNPRQFASDAERDACMTGYFELKLREGCRECFQILRDNGFTVWCFTAGDVSRVRGYFEVAEVDVPLENFVSCDTLGLAKPALAAYKHILGKLGQADCKWFAAAHMWDVSAAVRAGFTGAYCNVLEQETCQEIFGTGMAVIADALPEMARNIVAMSK